MSYLSPTVGLFVKIVCGALLFGCTTGTKPNEKRTVELRQPRTVAELASQLPAGVRVAAFDAMLDGRRIETLALKPLSRDAAEMADQFSVAHARYVEQMALLLRAPLANENGPHAQLRNQELQLLLNSVAVAKGPDELLVTRVLVDGPPSELDDFAELFVIGGKQ